MTKLLEQKSREYQQLLAMENIETIKKAYRLLTERRININSSVNIVKFEEQVESLDEDTKKIFKLMEQFKMDIKQLFINNGKSITHITDISPDNMICGKIAKSRDKANHYQTERGDWVFASSYPFNGRNPYIAREPQKGMVIIAKDSYIYGGDNMQIKQDEQGNNIVVLKKPNYAYEINPKNFTPVVTLIIAKTGEAYFEFSEEWISNQEVDINDPEQVRGIQVVSDITDVIRNYQVLCDVNMLGIARKARSLENAQKRKDFLIECIKDGKLRYINGEININVREKITSSGRVGNSEENKVDDTEAR